MILNQIIINKIKNQLIMNWIKLKSNNIKEINNIKNYKEN